MKKTLLAFGLLLFISVNTKAQISVNVNLGTPPIWAPADRVETQYYYLPDVDAYYDVPSSRFIYIRNGSWYRSAYLPYRYRNYNLKNGRVVYLTDYRGNKPYLFHKSHKVKYPKQMKSYNSKFKNYSSGNGKGYSKGHGNGNKKGQGNKKGNK